MRERACAATKEAALAPSSHKYTFIPTTALGLPSISAVINLHETTGRPQPTMPGHTSQPTWDGQDAQDHSLLLEFNEPWAHNHASHNHTSISAAIDLHETTGRLQPTMPGHASQPTWDGQDAQDHSFLLEFDEPWAHNHTSHDHTSHDHASYNCTSQPTNEPED